MTPLPSNLASTRLYMARTRRHFAPRPLGQAARKLVYCSLCARQLYSFKGEGLKCINETCAKFGRAQ